MLAHSTMSKTIPHSITEAEITMSKWNIRNLFSSSASGVPPLHEGIQQAANLKREGRFRDALAFYEKLYDRYGGHPVLFKSWAKTLVCNGYFDVARYLFDKAAQLYKEGNVQEYWQCNYFYEELTIFRRMGYNYNDPDFVKEVRGYAGVAGMKVGYQLPVQRSEAENVAYYSEHVLKQPVPLAFEAIQQREVIRRTAGGGMLLSLPEVPLHTLYVSDAVLADLYSIPEGMFLEYLKENLQQVESGEEGVPPHRVGLLAGHSEDAEQAVNFGLFNLRSTDRLKEARFSPTSYVVIASAPVASLIKHINGGDTASVIRVQDVLIYPDGVCRFATTTLETMSELKKAAELLQNAYEYLDNYQPKNLAIYRALRGNGSLHDVAPSMIFNELIVLIR